MNDFASIAPRLAEQAIQMGRAEHRKGKVFPYNKDRVCRSERKRESLSVALDVPCPLSENHATKNRIPSASIP